jgi:hypothetical protein
MSLQVSWGHEPENNMCKLCIGNRIDVKRDLIYREGKVALHKLKKAKRTLVHLYYPMYKKDSFAREKCKN